VHDVVVAAVRDEFFILALGAQAVVRGLRLSQPVGLHG
jgi:hypothetical protein